MTFFYRGYEVAMEHIFQLITMKTLQRELYFDYDTNLARVRCLPLQSNSHVHQVKIRQIFLSTYKRTSMQTSEISKALQK